MEGKKQSSYTSSSAALASDQFGGKDSGSSWNSTSSSGLFSSVFPPVSQAAGRDSSHSDLFGSPRKQECGGQAWNTQKATADGTTQSSSSKLNSMLNQANPSYQPEKIEPCFLGSSLYYGGQDICTNPPSSQASGSSYTYMKDGEDEIASRGNWWQGSLYY